MSDKDNRTHAEQWAKIRAEHGKGKDRELINRAIRAELPGGDEALDALNIWHKICSRKGWSNINGNEPDHVTAYRHLLQIVDAMEDHIREVYEIGERPQVDGLLRVSARSRPRRRRKSGNR